ncbi:hypothetical protein GCM10027040_07770 [Halomonas shantousis]
MMSPHRSCRPLVFGLAAIASLTLAGCASDSSSMEKRPTDYVVTGLGDDRDEALAAAKERALEQCEEQDQDTFEITEQHLYRPDSSNAQDAEQQLEGATIDEDTELSTLSQEGEAYKAVWTIQCR